MKLTSFFGHSRTQRKSHVQHLINHHLHIHFSFCSSFLLQIVIPRGENFETSGGNKKTQHDEGYLNVGFIDEAHRLQDILSDTTTYPVSPRKAAERAAP